MQGAIIGGNRLPKPEYSVPRRDPESPFPSPSFFHRFHRPSTQNLPVDFLLPSGESIVTAIDFLSRALCRLPGPLIARQAFIINPNPSRRPESEKEFGIHQPKQLVGGLGPSCRFDMTSIPNHLHLAMAISDCADCPTLSKR